MTALGQFEDIISLVTQRLFVKKKKGIISKDDFDTLATFGAKKALQVVVTKSRLDHFKEMLDEELRKALELISKRPCGKCKSSGISSHRRGRYAICPCVDLIRYRGDDVCSIGELHSNEFFTGELSKDSLGRSEVVQNIAAAVTMVLMPGR